MRTSIVRYRHVIAAGALGSLVAGCASLEPEVAFESLAADVASRTGTQIAWSPYEAEGSAISASVRGYLARELTPRSAVQVALLNNRKLQSLYTDVGIAQAAVVQAATPKNPIADASLRFWKGAPNGPDLAIGVVWDFIDLLYIPLRKSVAESELEEAKSRVALAVIGHAAATRVAYFDYVASLQEIELFTQVIKSTNATVTAARSIRRAGNITALQFDQQQSQLTAAKVQLAQSQVRASEARERLNVLMGVSGDDTEWRTPVRLQRMPAGAVSTQNAESRAIEASLEIANLQQRLTTLGRRHNLVRRTSLVPELVVGHEYEREIDRGPEGKDVTELYRPMVEFEIPIFDQGRAEAADAKLRFVKAEHDLWDTAVRVRSAARVGRARLLTARKTVKYYEEAILPEAARILRGTQKDFNAMQEDVFRLIQAKRNQIAISQQYIQALREYWVARSQFQQLMEGSTPAGGGAAPAVAAAGGGGGDAPAH